MCREFSQLVLLLLRIILLLILLLVIILVIILVVLRVLGLNLVLRLRISIKLQALVEHAVNPGGEASGILEVETSLDGRSVEKNVGKLARLLLGLLILALDTVTQREDHRMP